MLSVILVTLPTLAVATFVVPLPNGPYGVSIQDALLTDYSLPDPYLNLTYRRVPITVISSSGSSADCEPILQPYMPNLTASVWEQAFYQDYGLPLNNTLTKTELILCKPNPTPQNAPVILFAPGAGVSRYLYNILASAIVAQTGYTVITYDIPGQTQVVQFPDGEIQYAASNYATTYTNDHAIAVVLEDGIVVLDAIFSHNVSASNPRANISSSPPLPIALTNTTQAAMIGHSQGGAASLVGLLVDPRLSSAANMDGGLNATADNLAVCTHSNTTLSCTSTTTTDKPFLILQHQGNNQSTADGWANVWANVLRGDKWQVQLNKSQHATFGDYPYIVDLYGTRERPDANVSLVNYAVGSIPGREVPEVLSEVFAAFLRHGFSRGDDNGDARSAAAAAENVTASIGLLDVFGLEIVNSTVVAH